MGLDARTAQTTLENVLRDTILFGLGKRLSPVASIAALRASPTRGASGSMRDDDDLIAVTATPVQSFRWDASSTAPDDGVNVIQPSDVTGSGRWLAWWSLIRFAQIVGDDATTLEQFTGGPLARVIGLDKNFSDDEVMDLIAGQVPSVIIQSDGDSPEDATQDSGSIYNTTYDFTIHVVVENLRNRRQAAQGSEVDGTDGANALDGLIQALICGAQLYNAVPGVTNAIRVVRKGRGYNWISDLAERRVIRSRSYSILVTERIPPYASDVAPIDDVTVQAQLADLHDAPAYDSANYLVSGCLPSVGGALTQAFSAGSAVIAGAAVAYAGGSVTFASYSDTYRDLAPNGTLMLTAVTACGVAPAQAAGTLRIGFTRTSGAVVLADTLLCETQAPFGPQFDFPLT